MPAPLGDALPCSDDRDHGHLAGCGAELAPLNPVTVSPEKEAEPLNSAPARPWRLLPREGASRKDTGPFLGRKSSAVTGPGSPPASRRVPSSRGGSGQLLTALLQPSSGAGRAPLTSPSHLLGRLLSKEENKVSESNRAQALCHHCL